MALAKAVARQLAVFFPPFIVRLGQRTVHGRSKEVRRAQENRQLPALRCNDRDDLTARGARADDSHALALELRIGLRPLGRVDQLTLEALNALDIGHDRLGDRAGAGDEMAGLIALARLRFEMPELLARIEMCLRQS